MIYAISNIISNTPHKTSFSVSYMRTPLSSFSLNSTWSVIYPPPPPRPKQFRLFLPHSCHSTTFLFPLHISLFLTDLFWICDCLLPLSNELLLFFFLSLLLRKSLTCSSQCRGFIGHDKSASTLTPASVHQACCQLAKQWAALMESSNSISIQTNQGLFYFSYPQVNDPSLSSCPSWQIIGDLFEDLGVVCLWQSVEWKDVKQNRLL